MRKGFVKEAAVVGASAFVAGQLVELIIEATGTKSRVSCGAIVFASAILTHIGWEVAGGNEWFVENYPKSLKG